MAVDCRQKPVALRISSADDLVVALRPLSPGETAQFTGGSVQITSDVPIKHQFASRPIEAGEMVTMYGVVVGRAKQSIAPGERITTSNLQHASSEYENSRSASIEWSPPDVTRWQGTTFDGYVRSDGKVGTANHWLVVPMVFCENRNLDILREAIHNALGYQQAGPFQKLAESLTQKYRSGATRDELLAASLDGRTAASANRRLFPNVDGVKFLNHTIGCGGTREDARDLCGLLAGYITHPNVAGATVLSLGCQNAQVQILEDEIAARAPNFEKPLLIFEQQKAASVEDMLTRALRETFVGIAEANELRRERAPLSKLIVGLECGGSDGFSGITSNLTLGQVTDYLVALGGTAILSEFPELCGVEQSLVNRCRDQTTADRFVQLMREYERRATAVGTTFEMNPSPGNIREGLVTDAIKSAGAARKGGTSPVADALDYPEPVKRTGLNLLCTPGGDIESTTAMAGSGANLILFSTGMGTPTGNAVTPVIKVASNSDTATRLSDIIDFDAGPIARGERSVEDIGAALLDYCIEVASGRALPKAVALGHDDFIPWKRSISL